MRLTLMISGVALGIAGAPVIGFAAAGGTESTLVPGVQTQIYDEDEQARGGVHVDADIVEEGIMPEDDNSQDNAIRPKKKRVIQKRKQMMDDNGLGNHETAPQ